MPTPTTSIQYLSTLTRYISLAGLCLPSIIFFSLQETYLSADDLRINLWHMEITDQSFNIVDIKPANMEELTEVKFASLTQVNLGGAGVNKCCAFRLLLPRSSTPRSAISLSTRPAR